MKNKKGNSSTKRREITGKTTFGEAISINSKAGKVLAERQMFCGCCPMAMMETIEQGAKAHGVDVKELLKELNRI